MIICENNIEQINKDNFISDYEKFEIKFTDGRTFLYKQVTFDVESNNFVYLRVYQYLGGTTFNHRIVGKNTLTFSDLIKQDYENMYAYTYVINKVSRMKILNLDVTYSY